MIRRCLIAILVFVSLGLHAERLNYAFNHISTDEGTGLRTNKIYSLFQDEKGFIWLGTANGIQRFDGGKFVSFDPRGTKGNPLPAVAIEQLLPAGNGKIWLAAKSKREFGIFDISTFSYHVVPLVTSGPIPARSEFRMWQDSLGNTFISIFRYGKILVYDSIAHAFTENTPLNNIPAGWTLRSNAFYDHLKKQYWILCNEGVLVYDHSSKQMWSRLNNPMKMPLLDHPDLTAGLSEIHIDKKRRYWKFYWKDKHYFTCFDEKGNFLSKDTAGLQGKNTSYEELASFRETSNGTLWINGLAELYSLGSNDAAFTLYRSQYIDNFGIRYEQVFDIMEDRDGIIWFATDQGLYHTSSNPSRIANIFLSNIPGFYEAQTCLN